ncbi:hypothetical protein [Burkholderia pyrrocinia]|uniref:hypothetical protein n=1 Tax=Burkholderia pyrrocinia TaxID=60550 RepID=UPI00158EE4CA|nr:hypothetical protein [Burkholderia pyrrocinia]
MTDWSLSHEVIKAGLTSIVSIITLGSGWFVGLRISAMWTLRQKRRELALSAAGELHRIYGEFFAIWKLWNYSKRESPSSSVDEMRWDLLKRAALVEAGFEALLMKIASERVLSKVECDDLGLLRQGFQRLRENIRSGKSLDWSSSSDPEYVAFKRLSCGFANLLTSDHQWRRPHQETAADALLDITSNVHEIRWKQLSASNPRSGI